MRWRNWFRPKAAPKRVVWRAERSDGKCWVGEYRWQGRTFTHHTPLFYYWGSEQACRAAIQAWGFANVHPVAVEFDSSVKRPQKRRVNHSRRR